MALKTLIRPRARVGLMVGEILTRGALLITYHIQIQITSMITEGFSNVRLTSWTICFDCFDTVHEPQANCYFTAVCSKQNAINMCVVIITIGIYVSVHFINICIVDSELDSDLDLDSESDFTISPGK